MEFDWNKKIIPSRIMGNHHHPDQLQLFKIPDNNQKDYSEALEIFDVMPWFVPRSPSKYVLDPDGNKLLPAIERKFNLRYASENYESSIQINPVMIKGKKDDKGKFVAKYPCLREANIEKALRKMATSDGSYFDKESLTLQFQFVDLQHTLKSMGLNYYVVDIKEGLEVLASSKLKIHIGRKKTFIGSIIDMGREDQLYTVKFGSMYTEAMLDRSFRLYNNTILGELSSDRHAALSHWLFLLLSIRYKQASKEKSYDIYLKTVIRDSPMLKSSTRKSYYALVEVLDIFKNKGILSEVIEHKKVKKGNALVDVKFSVYAGDTLIRDMKKSLHRKGIVDAVLPEDYIDPVIKDTKLLKGMVDKSRKSAKEIGIDLE